MFCLRGFVMGTSHMAACAFVIHTHLRMPSCIARGRGGSVGHVHHLHHGLARQAAFGHARGGPVVHRRLHQRHGLDALVVCPPHTHTRTNPLVGVDVGVVRLLPGHIGVADRSRGVVVRATAAVAVAPLPEEA